MPPIITEPTARFYLLNSEKIKQIGQLFGDTIAKDRQIYPHEK